MSDRPRVLVVEDEEPLRLLYSAELSEEGYDVESVGSARHALSAFKERPPDVVLMDIRIPDMDGIEVMGRMLSQRRDLPVVLNTAYVSYKDDFRSWPAVSYVIKSADLGELKKAIRKALEGRLVPSTVP